MTQLTENNHLKRVFLSSPIHPSQARITFLKCHFEWHLFPIAIDWPIESLFYFIILRISLKNHQRFTIPRRSKCGFLCCTLSHLCGLILTLPVNVPLPLPHKISLSPRPARSHVFHSFTYSPNSPSYDTPTPISTEVGSTFNCSVLI